MQVYTNRKRAQTKAVNQARKEQEAAVNDGPQEPGQPQASDGPMAITAGAPSAALSPLASGQQQSQGASGFNPDAGGSQPAWGQQQQPQQQQYGAMLHPPTGAALYPSQHHYSNDSAAYMQMAPQAVYAAPQQPHSAAFPAPAAQPLQSATYGTVPQAPPYGMAAQSMPYGSPLPSASYQTQPAQYAQQQQQQHQQQPQVLNLRPLPGQSMADAAMAAIQAQQVRRV